MKNEMIRTIQQGLLRYIEHHANEGDTLIVILEHGGYEVGAVSRTGHALSYDTIEPGPLETLEEAEKVARFVARYAGADVCGGK